MMKKRLSKTIWYGSEVDLEGNPVIPKLAESADDLGGLHHGELYLHETDNDLSLWARTITNQVKPIGGLGGGSLWKLMQTESGEKYLMTEFDVVTRKGVTSFVDTGDIDLPSIYDGLPVDNQTLKWKEYVADDGSKVRVLVAEGGGKGTLKDVSVTGEGNAITSAKLVEDGTKIELSKEKVFAEKEYLDKGFLPLTGGTLTGDLRIGESFGNALRFGDRDFCMIEEDTDDHMRIYAGMGLDVQTPLYFGVSGQGIKLNGGVLKYNSTDGYWELDGDLLVNGGISSFSSSTAYKPSTIMDGVVTDEKTIRKNEYGQLEAVQKADDSGVKVKIVSKGDAMDEQNVLYVIV